MTDGYWTPRTRKMYFDKFAKEQGFDPLIPKNWHDVDMKLLKKRPVVFSPFKLSPLLYYPLASPFVYFWLQKIRAVIAEFGSGLGNTLLNTYPDIGLTNITFTAKLNNCMYPSPSLYLSLPPSLLPFRKILIACQSIYSELQGF